MPSPRNGTNLCFSTVFGRELWSDLRAGVLLRACTCRPLSANFARNYCLRRRFFCIQGYNITLYRKLQEENSDLSSGFAARQIRTGYWLLAAGFWLLASGVTGIAVSGQQQNLIYCKAIDQILNSIFLPSGAVNRSSRAVRYNRSAFGPPYFRSPTRGSPREANCTRI